MPLKRLKEEYLQRRLNRRRRHSGMLPRGDGPAAFWHDIKFSLRHLKDFSRLAVVCPPDTHHLWSSLVAPFMSCTVEHFAPGQEDAARDWLLWPEGAVD